MQVICSGAAKCNLPCEDGHNVPHMRCQACPETCYGGAVCVPVQSDFEQAAEKELTIVVPLLPPSELLPNKKLHWTQKYQAGRTFGEAVKLLAISARNLWEREHKQKWEPLSQAVVTLQFYYPLSTKGPLPDRDGLITACKPLFDALTARNRNGKVGAGIVVDDGPEEVKPVIETVTKLAGESKTVIVVRPDAVIS